MNGKVFLTGANGFIGGHLARRLAQRGYEVVCLVRDPEKAEPLKGPGITLIKGDILDRASMRDVMQDTQAVFHVAGWYAIGHLDEGRMRAANIEGARNVLELAAELGVPKILHTSTVGVFGNTRGKIVDETYRAPKAEMVSKYERTKWIAHYEVAVPLQKEGASVIILQPGGVTGAGDRSPHVRVFELFLRKTPLMLGADSGLTFAHVDDIAEGHILAFEKGRAGQAYILAGEALTYKQIFEISEKITGIGATKLWASGSIARNSSTLMRSLERVGLRAALSSEELATMDDYTYWATADKAERELGWQPRPTEETLGDLLRYLQGKSA